MSANERFGLTGAACILTGATSAVGLACARLLVRRGRGRRARRRRRRPRRRGRRSKIGCTAVVGDPASEETAEEAVAGGDDPHRQARRADPLRHAPAGASRSRTRTCRTWDSIVAVNLRGAFAFARVAMRSMTAYSPRCDRLRHAARRDRRRLCPVRTSSRRPTAGVHGLTRALARSGGPHGVRANAVVAGYLDTPTSRPLVEAERAAALGRDTARAGRPARRRGERRRLARVVGCRVRNRDGGARRRRAGSVSPPRRPWRPTAWFQTRCSSHPPTSREEPST